MLVRSLKTLQCTTEEAEDGLEAVRMVQASMVQSSQASNLSLVTIATSDSAQDYPTTRRPFDLILCDSVMPNMAGPEAVKQIRAMGFTRPILGVTGNTLPEQIEDFIAHGVNEVIAKPVKLDVLKDSLIKHHSAYLTSV